MIEKPASLEGAGILLEDEMPYNAWRIKYDLQYTMNKNLLKLVPDGAYDVKCTLTAPDGREATFAVGAELKNGTLTVPSHRIPEKTLEELGELHECERYDQED